jgi:hypothetical protein
MKQDYTMMHGQNNIKLIQVYKITGSHETRYEIYSTRGHPKNYTVQINHTYPAGKKWVILIAPKRIANM